MAQKIDPVPVVTASKQAAQLSRQLAKAARLLQAGHEEDGRKVLAKALSLVHVLEMRSRTWPTKNT